MNCTIKNKITRNESNNESIEKDNENIRENDFYIEETLRYEDFIYDEKIKSVLLYKRGVELGEPFIILNSSDQLILRFDELNAEYNSYQYQFIHCNANWEKSNLNEMNYLNGFNDNYIENSDKSFNTHQSYVHYWTSLS